MLCCYFLHIILPYNVTDSAALSLARLLVESGSKNAVQVLSGGYERFSALYPFLRTQKILWTPQVCVAVGSDCVRFGKVMLRSNWWK